MGFDGVAFGEYSNPSLTTISFDKVAFGKKAFELLYDSISRGNTSYYMNELELIERQSTAPCRVIENLAEGG